MPIQRDTAAGPADYELLGELARRHLVSQTMPVERVVLNIDPQRFLQAIAETDNEVSAPAADSEFPNDLPLENPVAFAIGNVDGNDDFILQGRLAIGEKIIGVAWQIAIVIASAGVSAGLIRLWIYG